MYGMVNKAIEAMVHADHGERMWEKIKRKAGVDVEVFISNEGYPDEMTFALVVAASEELDTPVPLILEAFGEHWILKTALGDYGDMLSAGGSSLSEFLINLPTFHARVSLMLPHLQPPRFRLMSTGENWVRIGYESSREGLCPFVVGLFRGLGKMYGTPATVQHVADKSAGAAFDEFLVSW